jgi:hypothetical protein
MGLTPEAGGSKSSFNGTPGVFIFDCIELFSSSLQISIVFEVVPSKQ